MTRMAKRRAEADPDRDAAAERRAREEVAAELVGAERMLRGSGSAFASAKSTSFAVVRRDDRPEDAVEDEEDEDDAGDDGALVPDVAPPGVPPEVRLADRRARRGRDRVLGREPFLRGCRVGDGGHYVRASRVRGSRTP